MKVESYRVHTYFRTEFGMSEQELYTADKEKRNVIFNRAFVKFAKHRLYHDGLRNLKDKKDRFDNYVSFDHIESVEELTRDINITLEKSKSRLETYKRKLHLTRKERFEKRKRTKIKQLSNKEYQLKWQPKSKLTMERLKRLKKLQEQEKNNEYER